MLLAIWCGLTLQYLPYKESSTRPENVIYHIREK